MTDKIKKKSNAGRPTKYKVEYGQLLIEHMKKGLSFRTFGPTIDVCEDTLNEWAKVHHEFSVSKKKAFEVCMTFWEAIGVKASLGRIPNFSSAAWIFNMKNRFKWTDRQEIKHELVEPILIETSRGTAKLSTKGDKD